MARKQAKKVKDTGADKTTRSDVAAEVNKAVDATSVDKETLTADNAVAVFTENEVAKRNRKVAELGTSKEEK